MWHNSIRRSTTADDLVQAFQHELEKWFPPGANEPDTNYTMETFHSDLQLVKKVIGEVKNDEDFLSGQSLASYTSEELKKKNDDLSQAGMGLTQIVAPRLGEERLERPHLSAWFPQSGPCLTIGDHKPDLKDVETAVSNLAVSKSSMLSSSEAPQLRDFVMLARALDLSDEPKRRHGFVARSPYQHVDGVWNHPGCAGLLSYVESVPSCSMKDLADRLNELALAIRHKASEHESRMSHQKELRDKICDAVEMLRANFGLILQSSVMQFARQLNGVVHSVKPLRGIGHDVPFHLLLRINRGQERIRQEIIRRELSEVPLAIPVCDTPSPRSQQTCESPPPSPRSEGATPCSPGRPCYLPAE